MTWQQAGVCLQGIAVLLLVYQSVMMTLSLRAIRKDKNID